VQDNANTAGTANGQAGQVRDVAESGAAIMAQAVQSVEAIQASARRMDEIVGVIDGLAFQTNILALNAAVEAARAGESGRGFAVVASEVRSLSKRSAEAAKEIRLLIESSSSQVGASVQSIHAAGATIDRIVAGIREVASSMSQISTSSAEQSAGLSEITAAVTQLDEITQRNAQMVEHAVAKAQDMEARASTLVESVAMFQLQQGSPEEAVALVERAAAHRQRSSKESFLRDLTDPVNGFYDRDMYVFVLDQQGRYLAFGGNASKVGSRVQDVPGIDGAGLLQTIQTQADYEPGWVEYDITNPSTGRVQSKMSYVQSLDGLSLGCGVYKNLL
jgi:Methyl-accepting chemotaxis protein (MCP) signalling domain/Single Cache domain 2